MGVFLVLIVLFALYCLPSFIAGIRHAPDPNMVAIINLLLGWTIIGWCVALALAFRDRKPAN